MVMITLYQFSHSVMSDSLRPHESQHARPPCPSTTPGVHSNHVHRVSDTIQPSHPLSSLYVRQQKKHRCIEQSFGLCGRGWGWDDLGEWRWNMYNIICEMNRQSFLFRYLFLIHIQAFSYFLDTTSLLVIIFPYLFFSR